MKRWMAGAALALTVAGCGQLPATSAPDAMSLAEATSPAALEAQIVEVAAMLRALGPGVDAGEARRAAEISVRRPLDWAREWQVVDAPYIHNVKVVNGYREKGVCEDWADALEIALKAQAFRTISIRRGVANGRNVKLEHASVIATTKGAPSIQGGVLLDPWRVGQGRLYAAPVKDDPRYEWESLESFVAWSRAWKARSASES